MLGEQFMVGEEICGAVVSIRFQVRPRAQAAVWDHLQIVQLVIYMYYSSLVLIVFGKVFDY